MFYIDRIADPAWLALIFAFFIFFIKSKSASINYSSGRQIKTTKAKRIINVPTKFIQRVSFASVFLIIILIISGIMILRTSIFTEKEVRKFALCLDASTSMSLGMPRFKKIVKNFVDKREGDWIAVSVYSGHSGKEGGAFIIRPLTSNLAKVKDKISIVEPRMFGAYTALGEGIWTAAISLIQDELTYLEKEKGITLSLVRLRQAMKEYDDDYLNYFSDTVGHEENRIIIIFTDGIYNTGIHPKFSVNLIKKLGIKLYMVTLKPTAATGVGKSDAELRIKEIKQAAVDTGGAYFDGENYDDIERLYHKIDILEKSKVFIRQAERLEDNYSNYAFLAMFLYAIFLIIEYWFIRGP